MVKLLDFGIAKAARCGPRPRRHPASTSPASSGSPRIRKPRADSRRAGHDRKRCVFTRRAALQAPHVAAPVCHALRRLLRHGAPDLRGRASSAQALRSLKPRMRRRARRICAGISTRSFSRRCRKSPTSATPRSSNSPKTSAAISTGSPVMAVPESTGYRVRQIRRPQSPARRRRQCRGRLPHHRDARNAPGRPTSPLRSASARSGTSKTFISSRRHCCWKCTTRSPRSRAPNRRASASSPTP